MSSTNPWGWTGDEQTFRAAHLYPLNPPSAYQRYVKRGLDLAFGALLFVLTGPVLLIGMLLILLTLGRPVIYRQKRVGLGGRSFELYKVRTMIPDRRTGDSSDHQGPERRSVHKSPEDPRIPPIAAWLRALRLDELPQLWNVIKGDMSLVGPRPELLEIVAEYEDWQHLRHVVKPGVTGLWQVSAPPNKLMHECTELDIEYISMISLETDLAILLRTPSAMLRRRGF